MIEEVLICLFTFENGEEERVRSLTSDFSLIDGMFIPFRAGGGGGGGAGAGGTDDAVGAGGGAGGPANADGAGDAEGGGGGAGGGGAFVEKDVSVFWTDGAEIVHMYLNL